MGLEFVLLLASYFPPQHLRINGQDWRVNVVKEVEAGYGYDGQTHCERRLIEIQASGPEVGNGLPWFMDRIKGRSRTFLDVSFVSIDRHGGGGATASQIISLAIESGLVSIDPASGASKKFARYVPFWA